MLLLVITNLVSITVFVSMEHQEVESSLVTVLELNLLSRLIFLSLVLVARSPQPLHVTLILAEIQVLVQTTQQHLEDTNVLVQEDGSAPTVTSPQSTPATQVVPLIPVVLSENASPAKPLQTSTNVSVPTDGLAPNVTSLQESVLQIGPSLKNEISKTNKMNKLDSEIQSIV